MIGFLLILLSAGRAEVDALPAQTEITDEQLHAIHNVTDIPAEWENILIQNIALKTFYQSQ